MTRPLALILASMLVAPPAFAGRRRNTAPGVVAGYGSEVTLSWIAQRKRPLSFDGPKTRFYLSPQAGGDYPLGSDANDGLAPTSAEASCGAAAGLPGYRHDFWNARLRNGAPRVSRDRMRIPREIFGTEIRGFDRAPRHYGARQEPE